MEQRTTATNNFSRKIDIYLFCNSVEAMFFGNLSPKEIKKKPSVVENAYMAVKN